jgi:hypothetical protein
MESLLLRISLPKAVYPYLIKSKISQKSEQFLPPHPYPNHCLHDFSVTFPLALSLETSQSSDSK